MQASVLRGVGLRLRPELLEVLSRNTHSELDFIEVVPENWMGRDGQQLHAFERLAERYDMVAQGRFLSLGGPAPLDARSLARLRAFLERYNVSLYCEHLSRCSYDGHPYNLPSPPHTMQAASELAARIEQAQDTLGRRVAIETAPCYRASPLDEMSGPEFLGVVSQRAGCLLRLDMNQLHDAAVNRGLDPCEYLTELPSQRIAYIHVSGIYRQLRQGADQEIDHSATAVPLPVRMLLEHAYAVRGVRPTLLECRLNAPPLPQLLSEARRLRAMQSQNEPRHSVVPTLLPAAIVALKVWEIEHSLAG